MAEHGGSTRRRRKHRKRKRGRHSPTADPPPPSPPAPQPTHAADASGDTATARSMASVASLYEEVIVDVGGGGEATLAGGEVVACAALAAVLACTVRVCPRSGGGRGGRAGGALVRLVGGEQEHGVGRHWSTAGTCRGLSLTLRAELMRSCLVGWEMAPPAACSG